MDDKDFKISSKQLEKEFLCNVCFNDIDDCYITRCGHVYCKKCIFQSINRHHRCPFCNVELVEADVFKNYHFNTLRKILYAQKTEAAKKYLQKVFEHQEVAQQLLLSPIQKALNQNYKNTLLNYRKYAKQFFQNLQKVQEKKGQQKQSNSNLKTPEQIIQEIHKILIPHVSTSLIPPTLILHRFTVSFVVSPIKSLNITMQLNAITPISTLISQIQIVMKQNNIRIQYIQPRQNALITINDLKYKISDVIGENIQLLWNKPLTINIIQGINIVRNAQCFTYKWVQGKKTHYFSCKDCKINWVCQACKDYCHEGHVLVEHLKDQSPNWSCCYCVTKYNCKALNKNT